MGKKIQTATGVIDSADMGITSLHEHVPLNRASTELEREDAHKYCVAELKKAKSLGLKTIVEVTPRRDVVGIQRVAEESEMQIIVCTGFYIDLTPEETRYSVDELRRHMMTEVGRGISGTAIKPGVIKLAARDENLTAAETNLFRAGGMVQKETGLPICTHAVAGCMRQQDLLEEAGADLSKVYYSHVEAAQGWEGRSLGEQIDYLSAVVSKGSTLSYNNFGNWAHTSQDQLGSIIKAMIERGFADNQVATMDLIFDYVDGERKVLWEDINIEGKIRTYRYLLSHAVPWMASQGISAENIEKMIVASPNRIFGS